MKIKNVEINNRKKAFEIEAESKNYTFPYSYADPEPKVNDRIKKVYVDEEIAAEGFTYELESGGEGTIHIEQVLDYNKDPDYLQKMWLYKLTVAARARIEECALSKREISRKLRTSPTQLYRLLDQTNYNKSIGQMLALLEVLNYEIELVIKKKAI
ncbi:hypothetical protein KAJ27_04245 [bacterium]|nr:hypothetical protein [bacterium]